MVRCAQPRRRSPVVDRSMLTVGKSVIVMLIESSNVLFDAGQSSIVTSGALFSGARNFGFFRSRRVRFF